jgi:Ca-activated chloride channel family protein
MLENIRFVNPEWFFLLLLIPAGVAWFLYQRKSRYPQFRMSSLHPIKGMRSVRGVLRDWLPLLRALAAIAFIVALARPQSILKKEDIKAEGIDIFLVMDLSNSMLARDFKPNRLEVSKKVAQEFVAKRQYDRIGLSVFAGEAFTQCPLTTDHKILQEFLAGLQVEIFEEQGTAIGMGLGSAVNWLKESESKSKIVILLTDGVNNKGYIPPGTAAEIAKKFDIKVYTIGVGSNGMALTPTALTRQGEYAYNLVPVHIDEELLRSISQTTGGQYFRATDEKSLEQIYDQIDQLEKTELEITTINRYSEEFHPFALIGLLLLGLEALLRYTVLRTIP